MVAHYILHTINTNDGDIFQMVPRMNMCLCVYNDYHWVVLSIHLYIDGMV